MNIPEFNDYNFSKTHRTSVKWMEVQANSITRYIQMPEEQAEEAILSFFDRKVGEPDWAEYRELIDDIKGKFRTARNTAKRIIVELGWKDVDDSNEKYSLRVWLIRLGLNGAEFKSDRKRLMAPLSGHSAFRNDAERERWEAKQLAKKEALKVSKAGKEIQDDAVSE